MGSKVYFKEISNDASAALIAQSNLDLILKTDILNKIKNGDFVAIKMHFGDRDNYGHIKPETVKILADEIKKRGGRPVLVETSTLYVGARSNAYDHINIAYKHGFTYENTGAPIVMADGLLGNNQVAVEINGKHYKKVFVAADVPHYDFIISLAHVTGHVIAGVGAAIKNIAMGLASRGGKLSQHSTVSPSINAKKCKKCGRCKAFCPAGAITAGAEGIYIIDKVKCIGCGECLAVCKHDAVNFSWKQASKIVQEKMAEHAIGVISGKEGRMLYANHAIYVTKECDCMAKKDGRIFDDIGIFVSDDPVAVDYATLNVIKEKIGKEYKYDENEPLDPMHQINHGAAVGLGSKSYELIKIK
ncbi:MAG: DUF362 domain-containing protein [Candidatus Wallbacteria bacterium]